MIRHGAETLAAVQFNLFVVADRAFFLHVLAELLGLESVNTVFRPEFPNLFPGQHVVVAGDMSSVEPDADVGPKPLFWQNFDCLIVADEAMRIRLGINFLGFEALDAIPRAKFAYLEPGQVVPVADDRRVVDVELNRAMLSMVAGGYLRRFRIRIFHGVLLSILVNQQAAICRFTTSNGIALQPRSRESLLQEQAKDSYNLMGTRSDAMAEVRNQFVRNMAKKVLRDSKIKAPPVDLVAILRAHNIGYEEMDDFPDSVDALIIKNGEFTYAAVNARHHIHRQRFSLAHELGHYFLHPDGYPETEVSIDNPPSEEAVLGTKSPAESEADLFAGELLVPIEFLKAAPDKQIPALSKLFLVSDQVIGVAISRHMKALFK
jgi:hypothetical protein